MSHCNLHLFITSKGKFHFYFSGHWWFFYELWVRVIFWFLLGFSPSSYMIRLSFIPYRNQLFSLTFVVNISEENIFCSFSFPLSGPGSWMPQSQLAWNVPWNSWRAFQAICSQLWCSHVRNDGAHSPCLCHHMRTPLIWWADRQLGGRMCPWLAEGCLANLDIPEGRRWATEIPFLKMNPFVQKESHRCCFLFFYFLRLGHLHAPLN